MSETITFLGLLVLFSILSAGITFWYAKKRYMRIESEVQQLSAWQIAVLDSADYCIISTNIKGIIATFNRTAENMLGYKADEVVGKVTPAIIHNPDEVEEYARILNEELDVNIEPGFEVFVAKARRGIVDEREWHYVHKDGTMVPVYLSVTALRSVDQKIIGFLGIAYDLTERKAMQTNLRETVTRYQTLFESAGDAICLMDDNARFIECNPATLKLFACTHEKIIDSSMQTFSPDVQANEKPSHEEIQNKVNAAFSGEYQFFEWTHIKDDGTLFDAEVSLSIVRIDNKPYIQGIIRDITERKAFEQQLAYQAGHDSLTGLPNRKSLHEAFLEHINNVDNKGDHVIMMLLDLDRFKEINDTLGHHLGDQVLAQVGPRLLNSCNDKAATIARLGGDEFAIIKSTGKSNDEIRATAENLITTLREPFDVSGFKVTIGASIGIACYPEHGADSHQLLRAADVAMYEAKRRSLGAMVYEPLIDKYSTQRLKFGNELIQAVNENQLVLHYQPKINLATGSISGFEALVRWNHPEEGLLFPNSFIDLVEMSEVIHPFTKAVINLAVDDKKRLQSLGYKQPIAINLSVRNLIDDACFNALETAIAGKNLSTTEIELEITESAVMQDPKSAIELLNKFKNRGIRILIDDFGTGYSSLSYLRQLPVNALKIDRSFVTQMLSNTHDSSIVRSTIALAHSLDLKVIAEGVEDEKTLALLKSMDCDQAQGYGICRPQPLDKLLAWLNQLENSQTTNTTGTTHRLKYDNL